ncbi:MAG: AraC family transcriptional regulator [Steroidobacteraceae bacterium]
MESLAPILHRAAEDSAPQLLRIGEWLLTAGGGHGALPRNGTLYIEATRGPLLVCLGDRVLRLDEDCYALCAAPRLVALRSPRGNARSSCLVVAHPVDSARFEPCCGLHLRMGASAHIAGYLLRELRSGSGAGEWYGEQIDFLFERLAREVAARRATLRSLPLTRLRNGDELLRRIQRATDHILGCYEESLSLATIAAEAQLSRDYFARFFRQVHGETPYEFLRRKRALAAKRMLATTSLSVAEIARRAGFDGRSTLARNIRLFEGRTATSLRRVGLRPGSGRARATSAELP